MRKLALCLAGLSALFLGSSLEGCKEACTIGSEGCECTGGGACDPGLTCLSMICVNAGPNTDDFGNDTTGNDTNDTNTTNPTTTNTGTSMHGMTHTEGGDQPNVQKCVTFSMTIPTGFRSTSARSASLRADQLRPNMVEH